VPFQKGEMKFFCGFRVQVASQNVLVFELDFVPLQRCAFMLRSRSLSREHQRRVPQLAKTRYEPKISVEALSM
jgi:hypothetical protein